MGEEKLDNDDKQMLFDLASKELGTDTVITKENLAKFDEVGPAKRGRPSLSNDSSVNLPRGDSSFDKPSPGFMHPDRELSSDEFHKIFDKDYKDELDLYKRIHVVKEAFFEVFNNCVDIYFKQVKHKYGNSGVIFVPTRYIGSNCTVIVWPKNGDDPRITNIRETMLKMKEAEVYADVKRNNS